MSTEISNIQPNSFKVGDAFPNPFNNSIGVQINIRELEPIDIIIVNVMGKVVYNEKIIPLSKGVHSFTWNGKNFYGQDLPSGIYFLQFNSLNFQSNKKISYLK